MNFGLEIMEFHMFLKRHTDLAGNLVKISDIFSSDLSQSLFAENLVTFFFYFKNGICTF